MSDHAQKSKVTMQHCQQCYPLPPIEEHVGTQSNKQLDWAFIRCVIGKTATTTYLDAYCSSCEPPQRIEGDTMPIRIRRNIGRSELCGSSIVTGTLSTFTWTRNVFVCIFVLRGVFIPTFPHLRPHCIYIYMYTCFKRVLG